MRHNGRDRRLLEIDLRRRALQLSLRPPSQSLLRTALWVSVTCMAVAGQVGAAPAPIAPADIDGELWPGRTKVSVEELYTELDRVAEIVSKSKAIRADYDALVAEHDLADTPALYRDYVRVKLAFEATRDAGWWNLSWKITNEKPNSEEIWKQWRRAGVPDAEAPQPSAVAECDELSALFAFSARRLGVKGVGLYWPVWNHVVAVWTVQSSAGEPVRIVVPTSQIFLSNDDSLGTSGFDPWTQKTIYEYRRRDVKSKHRVDATLARFFVQQAALHGAKSQSTLQDERNERDRRLMTAVAGESNR